MDRQVLKSSFNPIFVHPEEEPNVNELNSNVTSIKDNLELIDKQLTNSADNYKSLLDKTKLKILSIRNTLEAEKERQQDINILCNKYSDFVSVINLEKEDFTGSLNMENKVISAPVTSSNKIKANIVSINGNGYEGNKFVYLNEQFIDKIINTADRTNITDNNLATSYEYSRITTNNNAGNLPSFFNKDSIEAECTIELKSEDYINKIVLNSERNDIVLKDIHISNDGLTYHLEKEYNKAINERGDRYNDQTYIYGSGIIAIEPAKFIKIGLKSNGYTDDALAHIKTFYDNEKKDEIIKKIEIVDSAKRHTIQVNDISIFKNEYNKGMFLSKELISTPVSCIALFCNEYINEGYTIENNVSYFLIINGVEHEIVPINCHRNNKKIIRTSSQTYQSEYVIYTNEDIKSAKLKIVINSTNKDITPYISDVKILVGGA